jgi:hypothetical protein
MSDRKDTTKKKKTKDENAPKGAKSSYMYFCEAMRSDLKEREPELTFGEVGKKLGNMWKELDEDAKAPWTEKAAQDKERYNNAMADYVPPKREEGDDSDDEETSKPSKKKAKKAKKDPNEPKRPMASYFIWMGENRESFKNENPDATIGELGKIMGAKWKTLSEEEKAPYNEKAAENKAKYVEDMKAYNASKSNGAAAEEDEEEEEEVEVKDEVDSDDESDNDGMSD